VSVMSSLSPLRCTCAGRRWLDGERSSGTAFLCPAHFEPVHCGRAFSEAHPPRQRAQIRHRVREPSLVAFRAGGNFFQGGLGNKTNELVRIGMSTVVCGGKLQVRGFVLGPAFVVERVRLNPLAKAAASSLLGAARSCTHAEPLYSKTMYGEQLPFIGVLPSGKPPANTVTNRGAVRQQTQPNRFRDQLSAPVGGPSGNAGRNARLLRNGDAVDIARRYFFY
jgi:hypothetical protein